MVLPILVVLWTGHLLAARLRRWRWAEREATAGVTGFIGDAFGGHRHGQGGGRRGRGARTLRADRARRADAARRDQVGTQLARPSAASPANAGLGLALLARGAGRATGRAQRGRHRPVHHLRHRRGPACPRVTARWSTFQRQGDVSAARLGRLMPEHDPDRASATATTWLRHGPPPFVPVSVTAPLSGPAGTGSTTSRSPTWGPPRRHPTSPSGQLRGVDLDDPARPVRGGHRPGRIGQVGAAPGPAGPGAPVGGHHQWNGEEVADPSVLLVPPRAAYVPQVPRLFSEDRWRVGAARLRGRRAWIGCWPWPASTTTWSTCPTASAPRWAPRASASPGGRCSAWPRPGR
jgi:ATP-binding cassette subfamily B protein